MSERGLDAVGMAWQGEQGCRSSMHLFPGRVTGEGE